MKCKNHLCKNEVNALSMDDEGYCDYCHNKMLDDMLIEESEETRCLSDESLEIILWRMNRHQIRATSRKTMNRRRMM